MAIYFKQLKSLICMLMAFTFLSLPAYLLFWSGSLQNNPDTSGGVSFYDFILSLSLGNLGEKAWNINELDFQLDQQKVEMFCETGVIGEISKHGIAMVERFDAETSYYEDTFCEVELSSANKQAIEQNCYGNQFCEFSFLIDRAPLI